MARRRKAPSPRGRAKSQLLEAFPSVDLEGRQGWSMLRARPAAGARAGQGSAVPVVLCSELVAGGASIPPRGAASRRAELFSTAVPFLQQLARAAGALRNVPNISHLCLVQGAESSGCFSNRKAELVSCFLSWGPDAFPRAALPFRLGSGPAPSSLTELCPGGPASSGCPEAFWGHSASPIRAGFSLPIRGALCLFPRACDMPVDQPSGEDELPHLVTSWGSFQSLAWQTLGLPCPARGPMFMWRCWAVPRVGFL